MVGSRYPRGITKRPAGWRIRLGPGGAHGCKSFPPDTPQATVEAELLKMRQSARAGKQTARAGSLAADIARYLTDYFTGRDALEEVTRHLALWEAALGPDTLPDDVQKDDVARVLNGWRGAGLAADTCNKRRTALLAFYNRRNGRSGYNPVREVQRMRPPDPLPRGLPYAQIERALKQLPKCKTRARLRVLAYTGMRPGQVMKMQPDDWDTKHQTLTVRGTGKGRGTKPYVIPLSAQATKALTEFDEVDAWGEFTWAPMGRLWKEAWIAATTGQDRIALRGKCAGIPTPVPYDLRHSLGTAIYRKTGDLKAAKDLLGHSSIRMTERYTLAAVPERSKKAMAKTFGQAKVGRRSGQ